MRCVSLHTFFVVFTLIHSCQGQSEVISPLQLVAAVGNDVILECYLRPVTDVSNMTVEWTRPDLDPKFVHVWPERPDEQNPSYRGRTSLFIKELKHGKIFLKISNVKESDEGEYRCSVPELGKNSIILSFIWGCHAYAQPPIDPFIVLFIGALILILACLLIAWKRTRGKFKKLNKETNREDGPEQRREEKMIYSRKDSSVFQITMEGGESETLVTGREEEETQDQHVPETELIEEMERPGGEKIIPSIITEKDLQFITKQEADEDEEEKSGRRGKAEDGEGERRTESGKDYLGICLLPITEEHKEQGMSGKSGSMDCVIGFHLDQKTWREEQQEHVMEERQTESDPDIKQLSTEKKRKQKNQVNNLYSEFGAQKRQQENQRQQLEAEQQREGSQRKLQSEMEREKNETEIKTQKDRGNHHHPEKQQEEREEEPEDEEGKG